MECYNNLIMYCNYAKALAFRNGANLSAESKIVDCVSLVTVVFDKLDKKVVVKNKMMDILSTTELSKLFRELEEAVSKLEYLIEGGFSKC